MDKIFFYDKRIPGMESIAHLLNRKPFLTKFSIGGRVIFIKHILSIPAGASQIGHSIFLSETKNCSC